MMEDRLGNILQEGDTVLRSKWSSLVFHKVLGFTRNKSLILSVQRRKSIHNSSSWIIDTTREEDIKLQNGRIYLNNWTCKRSLIKI